MNVNYVVNMIVRIIMRKAINSGVNAGINAASNMGRKGRQGQPDDQNATVDQPGNTPRIKGNARQVNQMTKLARRMTRM